MRNILIKSCLVFIWSAVCTLQATPDAENDRLCPHSPKIDFQAHWIWLPDAAGLEARNSYAYFRKSFSAEGKVTIDIAADTWYQLYIDGQLCERGTAPSVTSYKVFDTHCVTLSTGRHVLAVLVHHIGQICATSMKSRPGLLVEMTAASGQKIISDESWKAMPATAYQQFLPVMMSHFGFYEVCDGEKIPAGWTECDFNDSSWRSAQVIGPAGCAPWIRLIPRDIPLLFTTVVPIDKAICRGKYQAGPIAESEKDITAAVEMAARRRDILQAKDLALPVDLALGNESEFIVVDFGREVTGHVQLKFKDAKAGQKIYIGYDEALNKNGLPDPRRTYVHAVDRFYLAANQKEVTVLGGRGLRYVMIDVAAGKGGLSLVDVEIEERTYPVEKQARFQCSDENLNKLFEIGLTTTRLCMLDTYVDCPGRERVLWMDMYPEAHCGSYGFGDTQLWRRCLYLFAQNTSTLKPVAGAIKGFVPCDYDPLLISYIMYYVISTVDYVQHSGDLATGMALYPTLMKQLDIIAGFTTPDGLINEKFPGWGTFLDWSAMDYGGVSAGNNAIYILTHRKAAQLARQLGKEETALELESRADRLVRIFRKTFWSNKEKLFIDAVNNGCPSPVRSQWVNTMAVLAGIVKGEQARDLLKHIIDKKLLLPRTPGDYRLQPDFKVQTNGIVTIGTPGSGFLLAQALLEMGLDQEAMDYYKENWLPIATNGTFMEHFTADVNTSYCHGWGAGPVVSFAQYVLGAYPLTPGWKKIAIRPHPGNLSWAEGCVPTPLGDIHVTWKKIDGRIKITYQVPDGMVVSGD